MKSNNTPKNTHNNKHALAHQTPSHASTSKHTNKLLQVGAMSALLSVSCIAAQNTSAAVADETSSPSSAINHTNQQSQPSIHTNENAPSSNNASASTHHNSAQTPTSTEENIPSIINTTPTIEQNDATAMPFMMLARSIDANATHNLDRSSADDGWGTNKQAWLVEPNILEFQRYRAVNSNGSIMSPGADGVGDWNTTTKKSDMYAHIKTENNGDRYLVFDVFFNNDAKSMLNNSALQQYTWQIPWAVADLNNGAYKGDTLRNLSIEAYISNADTASNAVLSRDFERFSRDNTNSKTGINPLSNDQEFGGTTYKYDLGARVKASREEDLRTLFHKNAGDGVLRNATELPEPYRNYSYGIGVRTTAVDRAFHLHCEVKLRKDATIADIQDAYTWANTSSFGKTTNSAYTFVSGREKGGSENNLPRVISDKEAPKLYFNGKELTDTQTIDVYQGDKLSLQFGASDNSGSITNLHVSGLPQNKGIDDKTKHAASKEKPYTTSLNDVEFSNKNGSSPNEKVYNVVVSATDASGNKTEKTIRYNLKNLNHKYAEPTGSKLTVPWGHTFTDDEILKKVNGIDAQAHAKVSVFSKPSATNPPKKYFRKKDELPVGNATVKVEYADGSYHLVQVPVSVEKPLALKHRLTSSTVEKDIVVGDTLPPLNTLVTVKDNADGKNTPTFTWKTTPTTNHVGQSSHSFTATYADGSTNPGTATLNVKPKAPTITSNLTGKAGVPNTEVQVDVHDGMTLEGPNSATVTLYDEHGAKLGETSTINGTTATITVEKGVPAGKIHAVTTFHHSDGPKLSYDLTSNPGPDSVATKDTNPPTLTTDKETYDVEVGKDLTIKLTAQDDIKVDAINTAPAIFSPAPNGFGLSPMNPNDLQRVVSKKGANNTDTKQELTLTITGIQAKEVGKHTLTFSTTDAAGHTATKHITVNVKQPYELKPTTLTVPLGQKLDDALAKKIFEHNPNIPSNVSFKWVENNTPDTSQTGNEKPGKVRVTLPDNSTKDIDVKVTVVDNEKPTIKVFTKDAHGSYTKEVTPGADGKITIDTYHGEPYDLRVIAVDNSNKVTNLAINSPVNSMKVENFDNKPGSGSQTDPRALHISGPVPNDTKPGDYNRTLSAQDASGNTTKLPLKFVVHTQAEKFGKNAQGQHIDYQMSNKTHPSAADAIKPQGNDFPQGTTYTWLNEPKWNTPSENTPATVRAKLPDGSTKDITTTVTVKDDVAPEFETPTMPTTKFKNKDYYVYKVKLGQDFDISIKASDNTGTLESANFADGAVPGVTSTSIVENKDNNSKAKPAVIHIKGKAAREESSSAQQWSRVLVVKDKAGNKAELPIRIAVYTDADEYPATVTPITKPHGTAVTQDDITKAISTQYPSSDPAKKPSIALVDGQTLPDGTKSGKSSVKAKVTYPDGSTSTVEVPITIGDANKEYEPIGNTITLPYGTSDNDIKNRITGTDTGNGITWKNNKKPAQTPTISIVDETKIPNGKDTGTHTVQVKVTYDDNSSDIAKVTINIDKPESEKYTPLGNSLTQAFTTTPVTDAIKTKITGIGNDKGVSFKDGQNPTNPKVSIDGGATIPDGTQAGTFTIPVTITYSDGSQNHTNVTLTVSDPQKKTYPPTGGTIELPYGKTITEQQIKDKVTLPNTIPSDIKDNVTITLENPSTPLPDGKHPGSTTIPVNVKYPDGSEEKVQVTVTTLDSDATTYKPSAQPLKIHRGDTLNTEDIIKQVQTSTVDNKPAPQTTKIELAQGANVPQTNTTGTFPVNVVVTYPDGSIANLTVPVEITDTDKDIYTPTAQGITKPFGKKPSNDDITNAVTIPNFTGDTTKLTKTIKPGETIPDGTEVGTHNVVVVVQYPDGTSEEVSVPITTLQKDSDTYTPSAEKLEKKHGEKPSDQEIIGNVTVPHFPDDAATKPTFTIADNDKAKIPDGTQAGTFNVPVTVTYPDGTSETIDVPVSIADSQANIYQPHTEPLTSTFGKKPSEQNITSKVTVPNFPNDAAKKPTFTIADNDKAKIPDGKQAGDFSVPVTVTYPDGTSEVVDVPITVSAPQATTTSITLPKGATPHAKDGITNSNAFPDGTTFTWKDPAPDTNTPGKTQGTVVITLPAPNDTATPTTVEAQVDIIVVDGSSKPLTVMQGSPLPDAKNAVVTTDDHGNNKYPANTTFTWKPDQTPSTDTVGESHGTVVVTIPGQDPLEVPVTLHITARPQAHNGNAFVGDTPDAKDSIEGSGDTTLFPDGTTFTWKGNAPDTQSTGPKNGTVTVQIPGKDAVDVPVTITVFEKPESVRTTVLQYSQPNPADNIKDSASKQKYPEGTEFTWGTTAQGTSHQPDTSKLGKQDVSVVVSMPGAKPQTVKTTVTVVENPVAQDTRIAQSADNTKVPDAKNSIGNANKLPENSRFEWVKKPDLTRPDNQDCKVRVTIPGMATPIDVDVNVCVVPTPIPKPYNVAKDSTPSAKDSIKNADKYPDGTTFEWKPKADGGKDAPDTSKTGDATGTVVVTVPGTTPLEQEVTVHVTVKDTPLIGNATGTNAKKNGNKTTISGTATPNSTVTINDAQGQPLKNADGSPVSISVDANGAFSTDIPKQQAGTPLTLIPHQNNTQGDPYQLTIIEKPDSPSVSATNDGGVNVMPPTGADHINIDITVTPDPLNGPEKPTRTICVRKNGQGEWEINGDAPDGIVVDKTTGVVTIPSHAVKDGSPVTAIAKDKNDTPSEPASAIAGYATPQIVKHALGNNVTPGKTVIVGTLDIPGAYVIVSDAQGKRLGDIVVSDKKTGAFMATIDAQKPGTTLLLTPINGEMQHNMIVNGKAGTVVQVTIPQNSAGSNNDYLNPNDPSLNTPQDGGGAHDSGNSNNTNSQNDTNGSQTDAASRHDSHKHNKHDAGYLAKTGDSSILAALTGMLGIVSAGVLMRLRRQRKQDYKKEQ